MTDLEWRSTDNKIATVKANAAANTITVTGVKTGKTVLTGTAKDGGGKTVRINVTVKQYAESISVQGDSQVAAGKTIALKAVVSPETTSNKAVSWTVTKNGASTKDVTVSANGKVSAKAAASGSYVVRATARDGSGAYGTKTISVVPQAISRIALSQSSAVIFRVSNSYSARTSVTLSVFVTGGNSNLWTVSSSNEGIATATKSGSTVTVRATGKATGKTVITVAATDGSNKKAKCTVTVNNPATNLRIDAPAGRMNGLAVGKTMQLNAVLETGSGKIAISKKNLQWSSSNSYYVTVDKNGKVKTLREPASSTSYTITAKTTDGSNLSATFKITPLGKISKLVPSQKKIRIRQGNYADVSINAYMPWETRRYSTLYQTSVGGKKDAVSISRYAGGYSITGVKKGTATVTFRCMDGNSASCKVTVIVD